LFRWELEDVAREQLAGMPPRVQLALSDFMDAVVIVDPAEYQRRLDSGWTYAQANAPTLCALGLVTGRWN
jgi:hypothetical protein